MANQRRLDDPFGSTDETPDFDLGANNNTGVTGGMAGQPQQAPSQDQAPAPAFDRSAFRDNWMSSSGSMDDFLKAHPEFSGVQKQGNSKGDVYRLPSGEIMDLQIAKGINGDNAQHGWTGVGEMGSGGATNYYPPAPAMGQFGGSGGSASSSSTSGPSKGFGDLSKVLSGLFPGGLFNQDVVNRRTENAAENLHRFQTRQSANDRAQLAERGLLGSGAEQTAQDRLSSNIADQYSGAVSGIYANESENADSRMMQALQMATGMTEQDAQNAIDWFNASTNRENVGNQFALGQGNLALGNSRALNDYDLGRRGIDFSYDQLNSQLDNMSIDQILEVLKQRGYGSEISSKGYQG
jgi:hypothetical protein